MLTGKMVLSKYMHLKKLFSYWFFWQYAIFNYDYSLNSFQKLKKNEMKKKNPQQSKQKQTVVYDI